MSFQQCEGTAIVIGGTGAVGAETCRLLAERGSNVAFTYSRNADKARDVERLIRAQGVDASAHALDVTDDDAVRKFIDTTAASAGGLHTLIHAGGPFVPQQYVSRTDPETFRQHVGLEVVAFFSIAHAALEHLRASRGSIVAITTVANRRFPIKDSLSSGAKAGIESLVRAIAVEEGPRGVRANIVGPGLLQDGMAARLIESGEFSAQGQAAAIASIPLRRFGTAIDVAEAACFLASPQASYISGQYIDVDGGYQL